MSNPNPVPKTPSASLGDQLKAVLLKDGSAPALALLQHLEQANGNIAEDEKAIATFMADATSVTPQLIQDVNGVLFAWTLMRFTHFLGNHAAG